MSTEVEKKQRQINKRKKSVGGGGGQNTAATVSCPRGQDTVAAVPCPRGQNVPEGQDTVGDKINCYTGTDSNINYPIGLTPDVTPEAAKSHRGDFQFDYAPDWAMPNCTTSQKTLTELDLFYFIFIIFFFFFFFTSSIYNTYNNTDINIIQTLHTV